MRRFEDWLAEPGVSRLLTLLALLTVPGIIAGLIAVWVMR
jgi:hypothetical protein